MNQSTASPNRYINPVYPHNSADPFVLKYLNEYWCYCTGFWHDGRCFGLLHSRDLVHWQEVGGVMDPIDDCSTCYWAPEVSYENGRFLMYYAVGDEKNMHIRVAVAQRPIGPFLDIGKRLTHEEFAIDPHVFEDDDGMRYLFYATDFLSDDRVGTGTVCDRMLDPFTLEGSPRPITRALYDWQVFDPQRAEKGGVRWHTVEGPFVLKHKGKFYQMFSAGNWKNTSYGVSYAISDRLTMADWNQVADGELILPILRSIPGKVIGPGHNSVVRGPDIQQAFCIYHRWSEDSSERVLAIDRMDWVGERILVLGPTTTPQPAPLSPTFADSFDDNHRGDLGQNWESLSGSWSDRGRAIVQKSSDSPAVLRSKVEASSFIAELSLRFLNAESEQAEIGVELNGHDGLAFTFKIMFAKNQAVISRLPLSVGDNSAVEHCVTLPPQFDAMSYQLLRLEVNGSRVRVVLDRSSATWNGQLKKQRYSISLFTRDSAGAFCGFALTAGWQDLFTEQAAKPADLDWITTDPDQVWQIIDQRLLCVNLEQREAIITKGPLFESYELLVNARFDSEPPVGGYYGFLFSPDNENPALLLRVVGGFSSWQLQSRTGECNFPLPDTFDPLSYQQFRFRREARSITIQYEDRILGEIRAPSSGTEVGLCCSAAVASFDAVRVTAIDL